MTRLPIKSNTRRLALLGILGAMALSLSFFEGLLPAFPFMPPGAKPGFSNIITMLTAAAFGLPQALYITVLKAVFAGLTRGVTAFLMSLAGGLLSTLALALLLRDKNNDKLGAAGISVLCAICHNAGQLLTAVVLSGTARIVGYAPMLLLFSLAGGIVTGVIFRVLLPVFIRVKKEFIRS